MKTKIYLNIFQKPIIGYDFNSNSALVHGTIGYYRAVFSSKWFYEIKINKNKIHVV